MYPSSASRQPRKSASNTTRKNDLPFAQARQIALLGMAKGSGATLMARALSKVVYKSMREVFGPPKSKTSENAKVQVLARVLKRNLVRRDQRFVFQRLREIYEYHGNMSAAVGSLGRFVFNRKWWAFQQLHLNLRMSRMPIRPPSSHTATPSSSVQNSPNVDAAASLPEKGSLARVQDAKLILKTWPKQVPSTDEQRLGQIMVGSTGKMFHKMCEILNLNVENF